jgi:hypothetical protein
MYRFGTLPIMKCEWATCSIYIYSVYPRVLWILILVKCINLITARSLIVVIGLLYVVEFPVVGFSVL